MKTSRYVVLGIAAVAGILLFFLVHGMISGKATRTATASVAAPPPVQTVRVLIAAHDVKAGSRLADSDLTWQDWPVNTLNPAYIVDGPLPNGAAVAGSEGAKAPGATPATQTPAPQAAVQQAASAATDMAHKMLTPGAKEAYIGGIARQDILANEPIIDAKVVRADEGGFMAVMLSPGMRAMAVQVSVENTAGGFILPGDRVDIMATHQTPKAGGGTIDSVQPVLRNIRVLAIDQQVQTSKDKQSVIGATATLEVTPEDGKALALAKASGSLSLMLRSYADANGPAGVVNPAPAEGQEQTVRVFRPGQTSDVVVSR
ncbi:MAG: Flp pilus assembly protein CpaB [Asticcacaulis sp.]